MQGCGILTKYLLLDDNSKAFSSSKTPFKHSTNLQRKRNLKLILYNFPISHIDRFSCKNIFIANPRIVTKSFSNKEKKQSTITIKIKVYDMLS